VLSEEKNAGMGALGCGAIAKPGGKGNTESELGCNGAKVEDDGAESSALEEEVSGTEGLV
jgi:hypothetical protein